MTPPVRLEAVTKKFGSFVAVDDIDLEVASGEVVGLLGANGAGKTTAMRMLLGLLRPTAGVIRVFGEPPGRATRRRIGYVPQGLGLYRDLSVAENIRFVARVFGTDPVTGFEDVGPTPVGELPLGVQRRLAFAIALRHRPELLVLDEPTSGVGALARARLWDQIREAARDGAGILVSTHAMDEARQADRLVLMHHGRVIGSGSEEDLVGDTTAVVVTTDRWSTAFSALEDAGEPVTLAGTKVRVPGADRGHIAAVLARAGVAGTVARAPATLEEAMVLADRT